ncbi:MULTISPECIES: serine/threonine-protein kinase [Streptomyces]|uniref:non-specific serine/threonine protein kinase n=1 Tax=Streptomyces galilaeus TaxID=33899 RepID=A0ABW9IWZ0_STRGJ|nr:serine/threonine-protein kinase [Streptomyces galilaeus]QEU66293.1 serine/threonine protein kinase [Streptomyces galilaeus]GGW35431.1 serine/threonine-protein kinase PkaB [Streptomyces galilaeus]
MARKIGSRYTAHQILGRGSAGTVWLGEGPDGPVAVKLLREDLASDEELVGRFVQERTALLGLEHPNVVSVRDLVVDGNDLALVMDLVRGTDLRTRLDRDRRLAPEAAVAIVADVADGLAAAHAAGIVHRDVKPENILLDMQGPLGPGGSHRALLTDFGVAKLIDTPKRTRATKIIGTPDYLAPEIVEGLPPRASVDIYALATVLYELLAGFTPFGGGHPGAVLRRHVTESVAPLPGIPDELWQLLVQCLAKAPASRLRASEVAARLREQLPTLAGMPPLDVDEPDGEAAEEAEGARTTGRGEAAEEAAPAGSDGRGRRGSVSLVPGAQPDSNRDTHTSMRVPAPDELAGGAHGTARVPRAAGAPRPGSARNRAATRRRRIVVGVAAVVLVAVAGVGTWAATAGDDEGGSGPGEPGNSAPAAP